MSSAIRLRQALRAAIPADRHFPILRGPARGIRWYPRTSRLACWIGRYERTAVSVCARAIRPGAVVWDIGAHVGYYTLLFARLVGPEGRVHAVEPDPANRVVLQRHLEANPRLAARVAVRPEAVAGSADERTISLSLGELTHMRGGGMPVRTIVLADVAPGTPQFVKIDVEGLEVEILANSAALLNVRQTTWLVETHTADIQRTCRELFERHGYSVRMFGNQIVAVSATPTETE